MFGGRPHTAVILAMLAMMAFALRGDSVVQAGSVAAKRVDYTVAHAPESAVMGGAGDKDAGLMPSPVPRGPVPVVNPGAAAAKAPDVKPPEVAVSGAVLVLNSYHIGYEWSDNIMSAIADVFSANAPAVNLYYEYLDSKRFTWSPSRASMWAQQLAARYEGMQFDAIIVSDDIAYRFMLEYHSTVFPGVPVIFCGVNYFDRRDIEAESLFTGVVQTIDIADNVALIRKILPATRRIYAVIDNSLTGLAYRKVIENERGGLGDDVAIEFLDGRELTFDDLLQAMAHLENNSAVLMMLFLEDKNGAFVPQQVSYPKIAATSRVPVFQVTESAFGLGLGGGVIQTGRSQGRQAALMTLDVMRGVRPMDIPVSMGAEPEVRVDWNALAKNWGVSRKEYLRRTESAAGSAQLPARPTRIDYRICMSNEPIISRYNSIAGWFSGLAVELLELVAHRAGWRFEYVFTEEKDIVAALNKGRCDLAMPSAGDETVLNKLDFSNQPLFSNWGAVYMREGSSIEGLRDLRGKTVALVTDSAFAQPFIKQAQALGLNPALVWADSYNEALTLLVDGDVDAAVVSRLHPISSRFAYRISPSDVLIYPTGQRMAALKGTNQEFLEAFDAYIPTLKNDPSSGYMDVVSRYTFRQKVPWVPPWIWFVLGGFGLAIVMVILTRVEVFRKTRELRDREQNLRVMLDSIGEAVIATDPRLVITRINPVASKLTGWSEFEAIGRPLVEVFHVIDFITRQSRSEWIDSVLGGGTVFVGPDVSPILVARNGAELRVAQSGAPIRGKDGSIIGVIVVFNDVTESIAREERRRQSQKMEAIGQLAGGIAHDFNNILGGVVGIAEFLASRYREDPTILKYCGHIVQSGQRASQMTRKLLDFARLGKAESVPLSVNSVVASAVEILKGSLSRSIEIVTDLSARPDVILGDASQIENVVLNLGINARDAMPQGGRIDIETSRVEFGQPATVGRFTLAPAVYLKLVVRDNGIGMSTETRGRIFEPFFTTKETGKGTGLGLAAVLGIVEEHQGAIDVESDISKGTAFTLYFPMTGMEKVAEPQLQQVEEKNYRGVVLVIDDEPIIRTMAEVLLSESGFDVITASGGQEGLEIYRSRRNEIDVVLLDFIMPGMDGMATLRELKAFDPDARVVIASGFTSEHKRQTFIEAGAADAVSKPFSQAEICSVLARAASR